MGLFNIKYIMKNMLHLWLDHHLFPQFQVLFIYKYIATI